MTANYSSDENMLQAYKDGKDLYSIIASMCFDKSYDDCLEFYPEGTKIVIDGKEIVCGNKTHQNKDGKGRRSAAKAVLLGLLYGRGAKAIAEQIGKSVEESQAIIDKFFKSFPKVKKWIDDTHAKADRLGYVEDWYGRRRRLPEVHLPKYDVKYISNKASDTFNPFFCCNDRDVDDTLILKYKSKCDGIKYKKDYKKIKDEAYKDGIAIDSNEGIIAKAYRQSVNSIVQGGAATLTKLAMINIYNDEILNSYGFKMLITVHDEILGECPAEYSDLVADRLAKVMIDTAKPYMSVPMSVDCYNVDAWYSDEYAEGIIDSYKKYIAKMSSDEAFEKISKEHCERPVEYLRKIIDSI